MWSVIAVDVWRGVGYIMVILIAGLLAIPRNYYEAASIDGASASSQFRHITLPLIRPVLAVTTVLNLLYGLKVFDIVFVLTSGGPGRATETVYTMVFEDFSKGRWGLATALSTLLLLVMVVPSATASSAPCDVTRTVRWLGSTGSAGIRQPRHRPLRGAARVRSHLPRRRQLAQDAGRGRHMGVGPAGAAPVGELRHRHRGGQPRRWPSSTACSIRWRPPPSA